MKTFGTCAAYALVLSLLGCATSKPPEPAPSQAALLSAWKSSDLTSEERVAVVNSHILVGTDIDTVTALLGEDAVLQHHHGPVIDTRAQQSSYMDFWLLEYKTPSGVVALRFHQVPALAESRLVFDTAFVPRHTKRSDAPPSAK